MKGDGEKSGRGLEDKGESDSVDPLVSRECIAFWDILNYYRSSTCMGLVRTCQQVLQGSS